MRRNKLLSSNLLYRPDAANRQANWQDYVRRYNADANYTAPSLHNIIIKNRCDGVELEVKDLIVPENAQDGKIIVGKTAIEQPGVMILIEKNYLKFIKREVGVSTVKIVRIKQQLEAISEEKIVFYESLEESYRRKIKDFISEHRTCFVGVHRKSAKQI